MDQQMHTMTSMSVIEVSSLPIQEKLRLMEAIWLDLRARIEPMGIPQQHRVLLDARRALMESGESVLHNWDDVKHSIGRR